MTERENRGCIKGFSNGSTSADPHLVDSGLSYVNESSSPSADLRPIWAGPGVVRTRSRILGWEISGVLRRMNWSMIIECLIRFVVLSSNLRGKQ